MKKLFTLMLALTSLVALAQAPQKISYQAVARQASGAIISNAPIGVKFIIYQGSVGGTISYEETHNTNTNQFGLFTLFIGGGSPSIGAFNTINWAAGPYFIETQIDPLGGTSYYSIGTQQLMSVPYALYAEKAGNSSPTPTITGNGLAIVTPTTGSLFSVAVPTPALSYVSGTNVLSLTQGTAVTTATLNSPGSNTISITGLGATTVTPNGVGNIFTINTPSYSAGTGISISSGIITNTATSTTPTITGAGATTVSGIYPNLTINTPTTQSYSAGAGISISSGIITNTASSVTPTLVAGPNMIVNPILASNSYTVSSPNYSLSTPSNTVLLLSNGVNNSTAIIPTQSLSLSGSTLTSGIPTNSINLATLPSLWTASGSTLYPTSATKIGIGTTTPNNLIQVAGLINFENNGSNTSLGLNTGTGILPNNTYNTFVGYYAGQAVGTGTASGNTLVGYNSGPNSSNGNNNSFFGRNSGLYSSSGNNNTFLGSGADLFSTNQRSNATAIGYNAKVDTNNAMVLGAVSPAINVGIGTIKPTALLHILSSNTNTLVLDKQLKMGHTNQPNRQWIFSVDAVAHMSLKNENNGAQLDVMDFDNNFGNVGIGNINPLNKLSVISSATNAALYVKSTNAFPISAQLIGDVIVSGKTLTDSISISGPGTPTVGSVLVSRDNLGNAKWSAPIMFKAIFFPPSTITVNNVVITGIGSTTNYSSSIPVNVGGGLSINSSNMIFTAPQTGYYNLNATMLVSIYPSASGNAYVYLELYNNTTATTIARAHGNNSDATSFYYTTLQVNTIAQLTQGQQVILRVGGSITNSGTISAIYSPNLINQFSGNLLR